MDARKKGQDLRDSKHQNTDKKSKTKSKGHYESKLRKLKAVVIRILLKHPEGVPKSDIWTHVKKATGLEVSAKTYGLSKMSRVFDKWSDEISISGPEGHGILTVKSGGSHLETTSESDASASSGQLNDTTDNIDEESKSPLMMEEMVTPDSSTEFGLRHPPLIFPDNTKHDIDIDEHNKTNQTYKLTQHELDLHDSLKKSEDEEDTDADEEKIKSTIDKLLNDDQNVTAPVTPQHVFTHPPFQIPMPVPLQIAMQLQGRTDIQPQGFGNATMPEQFIGRFQVPPQGMNQPGMMFPFLHPMQMMGSPIAYQQHMAGLGQIRFAPTPQQGDHLAESNKRSTDSQPDLTAVETSSSDGSHGQAASSEHDNSRISSQTPESYLSSSLSSSTSLEESTQSQSKTNNMEREHMPLNVTESSPVPSIKSDSHNTEITSDTSDKQGKETPPLRVHEGTKLESTNIHPRPAWTHGDQTKTTKLQVQMPPMFSPTPNLLEIQKQQYNAQYRNMSQVQPFGMVQMPKPPIQQFRQVQMPEPQGNLAIRTPKQPALIRGQTRSPEEEESYPALSSSGMSTQRSNEKGRVFPSWAQIANPAASTNFPNVPQSLSATQVTPVIPVEQKIKLSVKDIQNPVVPNPPSVNWGQFDTSDLQPHLNVQVSAHRNEVRRNVIGMQPITHSFEGHALDKWQPFKEDVKTMTVEPISKEEFQSKMLDIRPVYVPLGKTPSPEQVNNVAKECIEMLADSNAFVSPERVEKLIVQRFSCNRIQEIGIKHVDQIPCIYDHNRIVCKINAYITAFLKTRSICTLHELQEDLKEFVPGKGEFKELKTGPLQRFPVVYQQFRFPPDMAEIPEITTMDILDHFNNYLTRNGLWVNAKLEMEPFMNYLVQEYSADNAYMLGIRIRSLPLALSVLKKAKRDSGSSHRSIKSHFEENLKTEIGDAFRKFRVNILHTGDSGGMEVRKHYLKMRPELTIMEIFDKFEILLLVTQDKYLLRPKFRRVVQEFLTVIKEDELGRDILHLAICMSNTAVEETVKQMLTSDKATDDDKNSQRCHKPPPRKDALIHSLKTYLERCLLNVGSISLAYLDRIEENMLNDFGYSAFNMMGFGRFLEFLLKEAKQLLEESGGLLLGSAPGGADNDLSSKPHRADLVEFIKQYKQNENIQPEQIEEALCIHYNVKDVRHLGYGNITRLLTYLEKHGKHVVDNFTVFYETTLLQSCRHPQSSNLKVGLLGHQTKDDAKICLHNCPLLENIADWTQWRLVFEPQFGKLKDFVQKYGGISRQTVEGGKVVTLDILALELKPGELIKIVSSTPQEHLAEAIKNHNVRSTAGHLVSMAVTYKGVNNMPLALISRLINTTLIQMHADEPNGNSRPEEHSAAAFVLKCILLIPTKICVALANQVFLEPLGHVVGSSKSKQLLVQLCNSDTELSHLMELGCLLGIHEWTSVMQNKCTVKESSIQLPVVEIEDFFENDDSKTADEDNTEFYEESDLEDVDEILAGDGKDETVIPNEVIPAELEEDPVVEDNKCSETSTADAKVAESTTDDAIVEVKTSCEDIINQIRRDEFGVGVHLSEDGQRLMKVQQERLGRSLDRLSKDLYSKDTHFVLELVQNADDNKYTEELLNNTSKECPSVKFVIKEDGIYVYNNELGFREKDIRALCDVGRSTKGKHKFGYIGQKGIGFKSVFRITNAPEVHSNGYHMKFDVDSGPMGYILPHWIPEEEWTNQDGWMTEIILKLKPDMQTRTLAARFHDIHPSLLLFLHRIREITVENEVEHVTQTMRRRDLGENVIEIEHTNGRDRYLVIKKTLDASQISLQTKSGADVESTEVAIAFPLSQQGKKTSVQRIPPKQPVFAFLPLRSYGFRFIIQGDFDVPSSREDVDRDSPWNQWLRNEIHTVFIEALDTFRNHPDFTNLEAVCAFLQFVPMEDEVLEFFRPVASDILKKLKAQQCVPTQPDSQGVVSWKMPSQTVRVRDPLVRSVISPNQLETHLNLFYLHNDVACMLNSSLTSCLGIETLTSEHLFQLGKALIVDMGTRCSKDEDIVLVAKWMACLYRSLDEFQHDDTVLDSLKSNRMLPLSDGELVSLHDNTVFYPIAERSNSSQKDPLYYLQQDVKSLHPLLLNTNDKEVDSQVHKLLMRLGVKQLSPFEVVNHHIIPILKSEDWKTKTPQVLVSYIVYIKEQTEKQASVCNLDEIKDCAVVLTSQGLKNPNTEPVHFPPEYGNRIDLQRTYFGYKWTLLDTSYLPRPYSKTDIITWKDFFMKLGVEEFLAVRKRDVHITRSELDESPWSDLSSNWPSSEEEFIVKDYYSPELGGLLTNNSWPGDRYAQQMSNLFAYLDRYWDKELSKYQKCQVLAKNGNAMKETESSISILLRKHPWLPAAETVYKSVNGYVQREIRNVMKQPAGLYIKTESTQRLLLDKVLYLNANTAGGPFCQFLGIKDSVETETVKEMLIKWSERKNEDIPTEFCTTLPHAKQVYRFLGSKMSRQDLHCLLREKPIYFVPDKSASNTINRIDPVVSGRLLSKQEIWLEDSTGLFDKYRSTLEEFHLEMCMKRSIIDFYRDTPDLINLFKNEGNIDPQPKVEEFIKLLTIICNTNSPKEIEILSDVQYIFSAIGHCLATPSGEIVNGPAAKNAIDVMQQFVKGKLKNKKVFPTTKQIWVSLEDKPMIPDNKEWEKYFNDKAGVHFLDLDNASAKIQRKRAGAVTKKTIGGGLGMENPVNPEMINVVLEACDVMKLSDIVDVRPIAEMISPCPQLQEYFSHTVPTLQKYLTSKYEDIYQAFEETGMKDLLSNATFYQAGHLEVSYSIPNMPTDTFCIQQEKMIIHLPEVYFLRDNLESLGEVASRDVAKFFSRGNTDCNNLLRTFLADLFNISSNASDETVESLLNRHGVDDIEIPEEDMWKVEPPVYPEPEKPVQKTEEEDESVDTETVEETPKHNDGPFEIRSWPPVANPDKVHSRGSSENPASNIWPPPAAKDYMKTVKELPSNVRLVNPNDEIRKEASQSQEIWPKVTKDATRTVKDDVPIMRQNSAGSDARQTAPKNKEFKENESALRQRKDEPESKRMGNKPDETGQEVEHKLKEGHRQSAVENIEHDDKKEAVNKSNNAVSHITVHNKQENTLHGKSNDNNDKNWRHGNHGQAFGQNDHDRKPFITGAPVWSDMATDYAYDDIGTGKELASMDNFVLVEGAGNKEIGHWGEELVAQYLEKQKELGNIRDYIWKNEGEEAGCPYDFEIVLAGGDGTQRSFIEVKSTTSENKEVFEISLQQVRFAFQHKDNFHIYRVFNAGHPERVKMVRIKNLNKRLDSKQVKLCIVI